jgi:hypothetical protein
MGIFFILSVGCAVIITMTGIGPHSNVLRAMGSAGLPIGFFGTPIASWISRRSAGRGRAWFGLMLLILGLGTLVWLLVAYG